MPPHFKKSGEEPGTGPSGVPPPVSQPSEPDPSLLPLEEDDEEGDDDETIDYRSSPGDPDDETMYAQDIYLDEARWSEFTAEQKIAANTGSLTFLADMSGSINDKYLSSSIHFVTKGSRSPGLSSSFRTAIDMPGITDEDRAIMTLYSSQTDFYAATKVSTKLQMKKRKEAAQSELREYYQGFKEAKLAEIKS